MFVRVCTPGIRQLQLMLLKVCLILGVEIHVNVEFCRLVEPPAEQTDDSECTCVSLSVCDEWYCTLGPSCRSELCTERFMLTKYICLSHQKVSREEKKSFHLQRQHIW